MKKTVGIIGGMGPMATADLFKKIIMNTPASKDQEHLHVLIDNNTNIPDRTAALLEGAESPLPQLKESADRLANAGAEFLIMPCNTAHGFYEPLSAYAKIPVLNMIDLTMKALKKDGISCAALFATTGTIRTGIYQKYAGDIELLLPDEEEQDALMDMIYGGVKAGKTDFDASKVQKAAERLQKAGAQAIILGCTELPLAYEQYGLDFANVDPTLVLAKGAVAYALGK